MTENKVKELIESEDDFTDNGFWTPQTSMLRQIREWIRSCQDNFITALAIDRNPTLSPMIKQRWPGIIIEEAIYPDVDAMDLKDYADETYDVVFSHQVLEHIPKPWVAAEEMSRILKLGGIGIHTTCAFNPRHGPPAFKDYYRFLEEGLCELFGDVEILQLGEWGNREAVLYNTAIDDGNGSLGGRRFHRLVGERNDGLYPWVTWIIYRKYKRNNGSKRSGTAITQKIVNEEQENVPIVLEDSHGIKFVLREYEKPYRSSLVNRACDDEVFGAYKKLLRKGDVVFDVGAHVGRYSVFPSRLIGDKGRVYAFEPVKETFWNFKATLALNACKNVFAINSAVSDRIGTVEMNLFDKEFSSWSSLGHPEMTAPDGRLLRPNRTELIESETIDNFCNRNGINKINLLKIDVEGFELNVLSGAHQMLLRHCIDYICFEVSLAPQEAAGVVPAEIIELLKSHGYTVYSFCIEEGKFSDPISDLSCFHGNFYASYHDLA